MKDKDDYINDLTEIRAIMERSSRFISLSGLSGVLVGIYALVASYIAYRIVYIDMSIFTYRKTYITDTDTFWNLVYIAIGTFILSVATSIILTVKKATSDDLRVWEEGSKKLVINLLIPLVAGGIFIISMWVRGQFGIVAPACLIFYGLGLINASKYTLPDIRYLGMSELVLGLLSSFYPGYGLIFWALGFGVLHIIYGISMYFKYER